MLQSWFRTNWRVDVSLAAVCLVLAVFQGLVAGELGWWVWVLLMAGAAALAVRSHFPRTVLLTIFLTSVLAASSNELGFFPAMPVLLAVGAVASMGYFALSAAVVGLTVVKLFAMAHFASSTGVTDRQALEFLLLLGWLVAALTFGVLIRCYHLVTEEARLRVEEMHRAQEELGLRRAGEERLRIARELHDSLVHAISVIKVQSGVATHLARKRGEVIPETTQAIQEAATVASRELKQTLTMLRDGETDRGVAQLSELVSLTEMTGLSVEINVDQSLTDGETSELPATVDHTVYRIVQEALTNASRHSTGDQASVLIGFSDRVLTVSVTDNGRTTSPITLEHGCGLRGMMERVSALGGSLKTAVLPSGGFQVRAQLPIVEVV